MIALRYYAEGGSLKAIGDTFGVSKSSVSVIIWEVSFLIGIKLKDRFLQMPESREEILDVKATYFKVENFPLCLTCIDGTHIRVQSFGGENAEEYRNRKTYFSINCQAAVSANVIFSKIYYKPIFEMNLRIRIFRFSKIIVLSLNFSTLSPAGQVQLMIRLYSPTQHYSNDFKEVISVMIRLFLLIRPTVQKSSFANQFIMGY